MIMLLYAEIWVGAIQLGIALLLTIINLLVTKKLPKTLKVYWIIVAIYFLIWFILMQISEDVGMYWVLVAWLIAFYWLVAIINWFPLNKKLIN